MDKVQVLTTCHVCHGASYLPTNEVLSTVDGRTYVRHVPCTACAGSGRETRWIDIRDFADLLFEQRELEQVESRPIHQRVNSDSELTLFDSQQKENIK